MSKECQEQQILQAMRRVLGAIVRETTPPSGAHHPLSEQTREQIRIAFGLIAAREGELNRDTGVAEARPRYPDTAQSCCTLSMNPTESAKKGTE